VKHATSATDSVTKYVLRVNKRWRRENPI